MGGQACVFYGAAQVSTDIDLVLLAAEARAQSARRPLLQLIMTSALDLLREALDAEVPAEQAKDRAYWAPLKAELEAFRRAERGGS